MDLKERIATELIAARRRSVGLTLDALDEPDLVTQVSPLMSPLVWDLAHIGNYEELWLLRAAAGQEAMRPEIDDLYDAFEHPRAERPKLPLLTPAESRAYIDTVRNKVLDSLEKAPLSGGRLTEGGFVYGMVIQHEHQHDETMLATHQLRKDGPALLDPSPAEPPAGDVALAGREVLVEAGPFVMGTSDDPWAYDNERGAHTVDLPAFFIDVTPVSNAAYLAFMENGGYDDPRWWHPDGWDWRMRSEKRAPAFWRREGGQWVRRRFGRTEPVPPEEPVQHVCWYEADAYARWVGKRLPTEAEWEKAASWDPAAGRKRRLPWGDDGEHANLGQRLMRPAPVGSYPEGASAYGVRQLLGDVWEWTSSDFRGYPGFRVFPYKEYSEVFFGTDYKVLRGGSWATHPMACRTTFRNWDYPIRRQIFAGFRCARDV
ncbi:ergothioneine biosynthesis protein EgtB [Actinoallomurus sp. CA-150999]|uniref:ergothioneine biosynthesis protein EgtB n=1 Tax=Actinoallomurus sp. CA-150999 TaxID=3239887 RepID=UPI003D8F3199